MTAQHLRRAAGAGLMRTGGLLFVLGVVAILAVFAAFAAGDRNLPVALNAAAGILAPCGLALALLGLTARAR